MPDLPRIPPVALTIAGSDSSGGAGIQADLKAMEAHGVFGMSVITAVTAQNSRAVTAAFDLPTEIITAQLDAVVDDYAIGAVKTGMLSSREIVETVADGLRRHALAPVVVDPVMISTSGFSLLKPDAVEAVKRRLLPLATLATPNAHEAAALTGREVRTAAHAREAARAIADLGPEAVLVKGGHLDGEADAVDVLFTDGRFVEVRAPRVDTPNTHGTGCTYASAIAALLARGHDLEGAIRLAKRYLTTAIRLAPDLGSGHGPVRHFWHLDPDRLAQEGGGDASA
jgi:hydroxymethylpyrimidine/phosphomethylpyrimidine kinase